MDNLSVVEKCRSRLRALKNEFTSKWQSHYFELVDYLLPYNGNFEERSIFPNDGSKKMSKIVDGTATRSLQILSAGMQSGLTSPARPWFQLGLADKDLEKFYPVRAYLKEVTDRMMAVFSKSNYYSVVHSMYGELGAFGIAAMMLEEDQKNVIRCYPFTIGEYYVAVDESMRVNTVYRHLSLSAQNVVGMFGAENVSRQVNEWARNLKTADQWVKIYHALQPNLERMPQYVDTLNMPWQSVYFEAAQEAPDKPLRVSGYDEFPFMVPRWDVIGSNIYGICPGMYDLPDVKMLQKMQLKGLRALDKLVDPPMNAPAALKKTGGTIVAGGVNYVDVNQGQQSFTPAYQIQPDFQSMEVKIDRVRESIKEGFYNDLFMMLALSGDKQMTAREVAERHEEKLLAIGPVVERLQPELLDLSINRTYNIMGRKGLLPNPPKELVGQDFMIEYISLLAQAQKMIRISTLEQTVNFAGNLVAVWPEVKHKIKPMAAVDEFVRMSGAPVTIIASDEEVAQKLAIEAEQIRQKQQMEQAERAIQGAKALSDINTEGNTALKAFGEAGFPV